MDLAQSYGYNKQMFAVMCHGFGANNKFVNELDNYTLCASAKDKGVDFWHYCPTQGIHDGKYLASMIIEQNSLKKHFGCKIGWGSMGIFGFPSTATTAYLNNYDFMVTFLNEKNPEHRNRLTRIGYEDVQQQRMDLVQDTIKYIKEQDGEAVRHINNIYIKECYKGVEYLSPVTDEHWCLDNLWR